jgi:hypothetical protein
MLSSSSARCGWTARPCRADLAAVQRVPHAWAAAVMVGLVGRRRRGNLWAQQQCCIASGGCKSEEESSWKVARENSIQKQNKGALLRWAGPPPKALHPRPCSLRKASSFVPLLIIYIYSPSSARAAPIAMQAMQFPGGMESAGMGSVRAERASWVAATRMLSRTAAPRGAAERLLCQSDQAVQRSGDPPHPPPHPPGRGAAAGRGPRR